MLTNRDVALHKEILKVRAKPNKATKLALDLGTARTNVEIASDIIGFQVLSYTTGATFTLTLVFADDSSITLDQTELSPTDYVDFNIDTLRLTNPAQSGYSLVLLVGGMV